MPLNDIGSVPDPLSRESNKPKHWITDDVLFAECKRVWYFMNQDAQQIDEDISGSPLWEGTLHKLFEGKKHMYSPVMKTLYDAGCCHIVSRGARNRKTTVRVIKPPTLQDVKDARAETFYLEKDRMSNRAKTKVFEQTILDMRTELQDLRNRVQILEGKISANSG